MFKKRLKLSGMLFAMALMIALPSSQVMAAGKENYKITKVEHDLIRHGEHYFYEGLVPVLVNQESGGWQYMNKKGELIDYGYDYVSEFSEGLAAVVKSTHIEGYYYDTKLGYIDPTGKVVIPFEYEVEFSMGTVFMGRFIDGYAKVYKLVDVETVYIEGKTESGGDMVTQYPKRIEEWYTIDKTGKKVDKPILHERPDYYDDYLLIADSIGYIDENEKPVDIIIDGATIKDVRFSEDLALVFLKMDDDPWSYNYDPYIVERIKGTGMEEVEEVEEPEEIKETIPTGPVNLNFTGWRRWDNGTSLEYKVTNNSKETVKGSYGVIICYPGYDTVEKHGYYGETEYRFANERYYPVEGSIVDYTVGPMETTDGWIFSQLSGEEGVAGEDLGKRDGHFRYIVVDLKSEAERNKLQSEMDSIGLALLDDNTMEENTVLQNWLESNFGVIPTGR